MNDYDAWGVTLLRYKVGRLRTMIPRLLSQLGGRILSTSFICLGVLLATEKNAYAYTDPGTGALIWQIVLSGLFGAAFHFRKLLARMLGRSGKEGKDDPGDSTE